MLKWAVNKKKQEGQATVNPMPDFNTNGLYNDKPRRSLDAQVVKKNKKSGRYQRRSIVANARRNNTKNIDKENIHFIRNTTNYYKDGFMKNTENIALKDVSNITPTSATPLKNFEKFLFYCGDEKDVPDELVPTPQSYSRRVREAKKRKLETNSSNNIEVFARNSCVYKSERRTNNVDLGLLCSPKLSRSISEESLYNLSANTTNSKSSIHLEGCRNKNKPICTTKTSSGGIVEIEYDKDLVINYLEKAFIVKQNEIEKSTLHIFGNSSFTDNPLYLKKNDDVSLSIRPLKRPHQKPIEFESSFKSPSIDKSDAQTLVREACSPLSLTPLAVKLETLNAMSTHVTNKRDVPINDVTQYFANIENPFSLTMSDEENSTEMENKSIICKDSLMNSTESTVSTTQMGDVTLEKMIEDIIKSTKIVKSKRRVIHNKVDVKLAFEEETPSIEALKDLFIKP